MRTHLRFLSAISLPISLMGACARAPAIDEKCKASLTSNLINPETVEFVSFRPLEPNQMLDIFSPKLDSNASAEARYQVADNRVKMVESLMKMNKAFPDAEFFGGRMRSEGKLGNRITQNFICMKAGQGCSCSDAGDVDTDG